MPFDWSSLVLQTINFVILVWLLQRFLYQPVLRMIDARRAAVDKQFADASAALAEAKKKLAATDAERAGIAAERAAALNAAAAEAEAAAGARRSQAERDASALLDGTRKTLALERDQALLDAQRAALDLGTEIAKRLSAEMPMKLRAEAWLERIEGYLAALPAGERDAIVRQLGDGTALKVVTASALPAEAADAWSAALHRRLGDRIVIAFDVDPRLVAGAELHFPNTILHFSWQNALASIRDKIEPDDDAR